MSKDVLLVKAGLYHIALPTYQLLEIIDLKEYEKNQSPLNTNRDERNRTNFETKESQYDVDQYRLWRDHVLPVIHMGHYLDKHTQITKCRYSLVYQTNQQEIFFLDVDHFFSIIHMDTAQLRPIFNPYKKLADFSSKVCYVPGKEVLAFFLDENHKWKPHHDSHNSMHQIEEPSFSVTSHHTKSETLESI